MTAGAPLFGGGGENLGQDDPRMEILSCTFPFSLNIISNSDFRFEFRQAVGTLPGSISRLDFTHR